MSSKRETFRLIRRAGRRIDWGGAVPTIAVGAPALPFVLLVAVFHRRLREVVWNSITEPRLVATDVSVGSDGLLVEDAEARFFVWFGDLVDVDRDDGILVLDHGSVTELASGPRLLDEAESAIRIRWKHHSHMPIPRRVPSLELDSEPFELWMSRIKSLPQEVGYRTASLTEAELREMVTSKATHPRQRVSAAIILSSRQVDFDVAAVAREVADPKVAEVLKEISKGNVEPDHVRGVLSDA